MTTHPILIRANLLPYESDTDSSRRVLDDAAAHLKYDHPDRHKIVPTPVSQAIRITGIKPFTPESVAKFQTYELVKINPKGFWKMAHASYMNGFWAFVMSVFLVGVIGSFAKSQTYATIVALSLFAASLNVYLRVRRMTVYEWKEIRIEEYKLHIPEFALEAATEIRTRVPSSIIFIEQLGPDPFIGVKDGYEKHYLDVWNESNYKQERIA